MANVVGSSVVWNDLWWRAGPIVVEAVVVYVVLERVSGREGHVVVGSLAVCCVGWPGSWR